MRTPVITTALLGLLGCGYSMVRADAGAARIGLIEARGTEPELGRHARRTLRARAGSASAVSDAPRLSGHLLVGPEVPVAIEGQAGAYRVRVELVVEAQGPQGVIWQGQAQGEAVYLRGTATPETLAARRVALRRATTRSVDGLWTRWLARTR